MAGHAEYGLRAFARQHEEPFLVPLPLENTIDVERITKDSRMRAELLALLRAPDTLRAIDQGTLQLPDALLATAAVSVSPHGLARQANRPFKQVIAAKDLADVDLAPYDTIKTPAALLRRLDTLTCVGCHQSRSLAGFHMLGVEPETDTVDAIAVPMSPHLHADLDRRARYLLALANGKEPDEHRPPPERGDLVPVQGAAAHPHPDHVHAPHHAHHPHRSMHAHDYAAPTGGRGEHCGLGDPGFAAWTCAKGLTYDRRH
jgi:hypothetical protein